MAFVPSESTSITGKWLYSDCDPTNFDDQDCATSDVQDRIEHITFLDQLGRRPIIGIAAGVARCALAIIHIIGHLFSERRGT